MENPSNEGGGRRATRPLNEIIRSDGQERQAPVLIVPPEVAKHYTQQSNSYRSSSNHERIEFVDRGSRMHGYNPVSAFTARSMVQIAEARGWKAVELTGVNDFKSKVFVEATKRHIAVSGYEPTAKDQEILQRHADRVTAASDPKVLAFVNARSTEAMTEAATRYPELANAFALRAAYTRASEQMDNPSPKARQQYLGAKLDAVIIALHKGEPLPQTGIRDTNAPSQDGPDVDDQSR